jgi:hypothetical protein
MVSLSELVIDHPKLLLEKYGRIDNNHYHTEASVELLRASVA